MGAKPLWNKIQQNLNLRFRQSTKQHAHVVMLGKNISNFRMQIAWLSFLTPQTISWLVEVRILGGVDRFVEIAWAGPYYHNQTWTALWLGHCQTCGTHPSHEFNGPIGVLYLQAFLGDVLGPLPSMFQNGRLAWISRVQCACLSALLLWECREGVHAMLVQARFQVPETVVWNSCCMYMCSKIQ